MTAPDVCPPEFAEFAARNKVLRKPKFALDHAAFCRGAAGKEYKA
jgi:hypothetical protein